MKKNLIILLCLVLLIFFWRFIFNKFIFIPKSEISQVDINKNRGAIKYENASVDQIDIISPLPGSTASKKFNLLGKARGNWFFEASFPVTVLDKDNQVLVETYTKAEGEWMTKEFVPFKGEVKIPLSYAGPATIMFKKNNPSDIRKLDASISFPINIE